jgi:hypothetical protein
VGATGDLATLELDTRLPLAEVATAPRLNAVLEAAPQHGLRGRSALRLRAAAHDTLFERGSGSAAVVLATVRRLTAVQALAQLAERPLSAFRWRAAGVAALLENVLRAAPAGDTAGVTMFTAIETRA